MKTQLSATNSTTASKENTSKSPAQLDYISTNSLALAYGQLLLEDQDAMPKQVSIRFAFTLRFFLNCSPITVFYIDTLKDGFKCPTEGQKDALGNLVVHPKFPHQTDCQRFYVCLNGVEPRDLGCQVGEVYNEESQRCDAPENVPGW